MTNQITNEIIKALLQSSDRFITADELAERLNVSRRTIFNNIKKAKTICAQYDSEIISVRSKGFMIQESVKINTYIKEQDPKYVRTSRHEYILYIIYLLFSDDEAVHISELEQILYLSKPTIYKLIEDVSVWLQPYNLKLIQSRKGLVLEKKEKRLRAVIKNWIADTKNQLEKNKGQDFLKLHKCLHEVMTIENDEAVQAVDKICELNRIHLSQNELENMAILLQVIIYRINLGYYAKLSENSSIRLALNFFTLSRVNSAVEYLKNHFNVNFTQTEIIYFMISVLVNGDLEDRNSLFNRYHDIELDANLIQECRIYLKNHLNINVNDLDELLNEIIFIIKREVLIQIKGEMGTGALYYDRMLNNYHATVKMARDLYGIIIKYYYIEYYDKMLFNIVFSILALIQKNKRNIRAVLLHNCDIYEYKYVLLCLQEFPYISLIFSIDSVAKLDKYLQEDQADLILSTIDYENDKIPVFKISKIFTVNEVSDCIKFIHNIYERVNFLRLIKNIEV